VVMKE